jgi:hypothetical protein
MNIKRWSLRLGTLDGLGPLSVKWALMCIMIGGVCGFLNLNLNLLLLLLLLF